MGGEVTVTSSITPSNRGPAEGTFYARSFRDDATTFGEGTMRAILSAPQTTAGDVIHISAMLNIPDDGANARAVFVLSNTTAGADSRAFIRSHGAGNVIAVIAPFPTTVDTGLNYTPNIWQQWELEYAVGSSTFIARVDGVSAGPFASPTVGQVSLGEIFNGNAEAGAFFVDAIPEPSTALLCVAALAIICLRPISRHALGRRDWLRFGSSA